MRASGVFVVVMCTQSVLDKSFVYAKEFFLYLAFPAYCRYFRGPHSVECQATIWEAVGCRMEGLKHPFVAPPSESRIISTLTLEWVICFIFHYLRSHKRLVIIAKPKLH